MGRLPWNPDNVMMLTGLLWSVTGFALYFFISKNSRLTNRLSTLFPLLPPEVIRVTLQRFWGVLFLGIIPLLIVLFGFRSSPGTFGLSFNYLQPPPVWSYALVPVIIFVAYIIASRPSNLELYPQIRATTWTWGILWINSIGWIAFLVAYEFLFRGFIFFTSLAVLDPVIAIGVNVVLYALAHFYKGPSELLGSIPIGVLFCYLTLKTGNIWSAVAIHSMMAISHEWFSLKAHPQMKLIKRR